MRNTHRTGGNWGNGRRKLEKKKKKKRGLGMIFAIFFLQHLWYKINKTSEKREKNILPQRQDLAKKETLLMEIL